MLGASMLAGCSLAFPLDDLAGANTTTSTTGAATTGQGGSPTVATTATGATGGEASGGANSGGASVGGGGSGGGESIPTDDMILWLDASTLPPDSPLAIWEDRSPAGNDASQPSLALQPLVVTSTPHPEVQFDGTRFLNLPAGFDDFSSGLTFFTVTEFHSDLNCPTWVFLANGPEVDDIAMWRGGQTLGFEISDEYFQSAVSAVPLDTRLLLVARQREDGQVDLFVNGTQVGLASFAEPATTTRTQNFIGIGLYDGCTGIDGALSEIILYQRDLGDVQLEQVTTYLRAKWSL